MLRYRTETRPGLVALYDIRPGNGAGPFLQPRARTGPLPRSGWTLSGPHQIPRLFQILQVTSTYLYRLSVTLSIQAETQQLY